MTLEDVALHLGLPINGDVVTGGTDFNVQCCKTCTNSYFGEGLN